MHNILYIQIYIDCVRTSGPENECTLYTSSCGLLLTCRGKDTSLHNHIQHNKACGVVALIWKNVFIQAGRLCYIGRNFQLVQSQAAADVSQVRGTLVPSGQMWQGVLWEAVLRIQTRLIRVLLFNLIQVRIRLFDADPDPYRFKGVKYL